MEREAVHSAKLLNNRNLQENSWRFFVENNRLYRTTQIIVYFYINDVGDTYREYMSQKIYCATLILLQNGLFPHIIPNSFLISSYRSDSRLSLISIFPVRESFDSISPCFSRYALIFSGIISSCESTLTVYVFRIHSFMSV